MESPAKGTGLRVVTMSFAKEVRPSTAMIVVAPLPNSVACFYGGVRPALGNFHRMHLPEHRLETYAKLIGSARAFHEIIFKTLTSSLLISILQYGAGRSRSLVLVFLLVLAYSALSAFTICFTRFVLFASFEQQTPPSRARAAIMWIATGLITGFVVALPSVFSKVVGALVRGGPLL